MRSPSSDANESGVDTDDEDVLFVPIRQNTKKFNLAINFPNIRIY
jgi:hypothetical protein